MRKIYFVIALSLLMGRMSAQGPVQYCVENEITHGFLNDFTYDTIPDLNVSYIKEYFNKPHDYRLDAPVPVRLSWTHQDCADAQRVEVSEFNTYADSIVFKINKDTAQYDLYNLIPGKTFYYRIVSVKADVETVVSTGVLEPSGMLRWILADGTWNVRDMGGWPGLGGNRINYGKLYRGGQLTNPKSPYNVLLTSSGIEAMRNVGIRAELDLRSSSQAHYSTPSFADKSYAADFKNIATTSARMWKYDNDDSNIRAIQWVIDELKAGKPVFYHCQNGADRTGTIGLLIGALLGMSEGDLAKDYELTTFCEVAASKFDPTEKGFARLRNYEGKYGSVDNSSDPKDYMFAPVIDKWNAKPGQTPHQRIYNFLKNGVDGTKISVQDLNWFIKEMVGYTMTESVKIDGAATLEMEPGQTDTLKVTVTPADALDRLTIKSSNPSVATVTQDGVVTAVRGGEAIITATSDVFSATVKVTVPLIEAPVPAYALYNNVQCPVNTTENKVSNGSFEYGKSFDHWKNGKKTDLTSVAFDVKAYGTGDSVYIESKMDGEANSEYALRTEWRISKNTDYVFGYRVKNSTDIKTENNLNLVLMLTKSTAETGEILAYPSYDGNWTNYQCIFNSGSYTRLRAVFSHMSQNGNNTCFDGFYLAEIDLTTGIKNPVQDQPAYARSYDINGREVDGNTRGLKIIDGKKVLISE